MSSRFVAKHVLKQQWRKQPISNRHFILPIIHKSLYQPPSIIISRNYSLSQRNESDLSKESSIGKENSINKHTESKNSLVEPIDLAMNSTKIVNVHYSENKHTPLKVAIGAKAVRHLQGLMNDENNKNLAVQVAVESGGCHGFQYKLKLVDLYKDKFISRDLNENIELSEEYLLDKDNSLFVRDGAKIVMDQSSLMILRESKIDYVKELIGSSFKVIDSPYTKTACGCGSSFDVDFSKLSE